MEIEVIKECVRTDQYLYSLHAEIERKAVKILEHYPDTGRGESCLVVGFAGQTPIHAVCGWRGEKIALITVYVPTPPKFIDPWTRGNASDE